jgi:hypothetical protein
MTISIDVPDTLAHDLEEIAKKQRLTLNDFAVQLLESAVHSDVAVESPTPQDIVARILATKRSSNTQIESGRNLAQALANAVHEDPIDAKEWAAKWAVIEKQMNQDEIIDEMKDLLA